TEYVKAKYRKCKKHIMSAENPFGRLILSPDERYQLMQVLAAAAIIIFSAEALVDVSRKITDKLRPNIAEDELPDE
ncbi:MAG: hypothetical protein ACE5DQ_01925, partial [Candidatus Paceibacterota bacterium]